MIEILIILLAVILPMIGIVLIFIKYAYQFLFPIKRDQSLRRMSFSSEACFARIFSPKIQEWGCMIHVVLYFIECPSIESIRSKCRVLLQYDRMRSKLVLKNGVYYFEDLGDSIDIDHDIIRTIEIESDIDIVPTIDKITAEKIDELQMKQLWYIYRIITKSGYSALLIKVHHGIGDGLSLIGMMPKLFTHENGNPFVFDIGSKMRSTIPQKESWISKTSTLFRSLFEVLALPVSQSDTDIIFTTPKKHQLVMTTQRKTILFPTIRLGFIKSLKNAANVTVNDIVLAAFTGMLQRYCTALHDPYFEEKRTKIQTRVLLPVAFPRPPSDTNSSSKSLRNKWAFVSVPLPINKSNTLERIQTCASTTEKLKKSPAAFIQLWFQNNIVPLLPKGLRQQIAHDVFSKHSIIVSNLPGPQENIFLCDQKLEGYHIIFPNLVPQVLLITYVDDIFFSCTLDTDVVKQSHLLPELFVAELKSMADLFGIHYKDSDIVSSNSIPTHYKLQ